MVDINDPRPYAHMVQNIREKEMAPPQKVAMINIVWTMYDSLAEIPEDEFDVDLEEAEDIMSELPTSYDDERLPDS